MCALTTFGFNLRFLSLLHIASFTFIELLLSFNNLGHALISYIGLGKIIINKGQTSIITTTVWTSVPYQ